MGAVFVMVLAGMRKRKLQVGVFGVGCFSCSFFLLGVFILNFTLEASFDAAYGKLDAPVMTVSVREADVTEGELGKFLRQLTFVGDYRIGKRYLASDVKLPGRKMDFAFLASSEDMEIGAGEVIVNNVVYGVAVGDGIEVSVNGYNVGLEICSVVADAVNSAPESRIPYFWMNGEELESLTVGFGKGDYLIEIKEAGTKRAGTQGARAEEKEVGEKRAEEKEESGYTVESFVSDYGDYFGHPFDGDLTSYEDIRHSYLFRYKIFGKFILCLFWFLFAMVLVLTVLLSQMAARSDRKEIGILKSIGFTDCRICRIYLWQYLLVAMVMGGMGAVGSGMLFQAWLGGMFANIDRRLFCIHGLWRYQILVFGAVSLAVFFAVWFSVKGIVKESVAEAVSGGGWGGRKGRKKDHGVSGDLFPWATSQADAHIKKPEINKRIKVGKATSQADAHAEEARHLKKDLRFLKEAKILKKNPKVLLRFGGCREGRIPRSLPWDIWLLPTPGFLQLNLALVKCIRRKLESVFLFVLTLGMALLYLLSFYIIDGVGKADEHLEDWGIVEMDIYVSRKTNVDERESGLLEALGQDPAVDFYYAGLSNRVAYRLPGSSLARSVMGEVYDKEIPEGLTYIFMEGRNPCTYREVAVGIGFARENEVGIGDKIWVAKYGEERELEIVGIYPSFKQYGNSVRFLVDDIRGFFGNQADGYYSVVLKSGEDANAFAERMSGAFADFHFFPMERSTVRSVRMLAPPMAVCMGVFALVYLLVVLCMKKIMVAECKRELDIYRFIGFTRKRAGAVVRWRFGIPVLAGMAVAVPLSVSVLPEVLGPLAQQFGLLGLPVYPSGMLAGAALLVLVVCGFAPVAHVGSLDVK